MEWTWHMMQKTTGWKRLHVHRENLKRKQTLNCPVMEDNTEENHKKASMLKPWVCIIYGQLLKCHPVSSLKDQASLSPWIQSNWVLEFPQHRVLSLFFPWSRGRFCLRAGRYLCRPRVWVIRALVHPTPSSLTLQMEDKIEYAISIISAAQQIYQASNSGPFN